MNFSKVVSDEKLQLITGQIFVGQAVLVAYKFGIFRLLTSGSLSIEKLAKNLKLGERAVQAMISCACALELVEQCDGEYRLSQIGKVFFDESSPAYYGGVFDLLIEHNEIMNFENIERAIKTDKPQVNKGVEIFSNLNGLGNSKIFVQSLYQKAFMPAFHWASLLKLQTYKKFVDLGGGSGIHTIAACQNNPSLHGIVCDREAVLIYAREYIKSFALEKRIELSQIDMWGDEFPEGDVYFLGDIFHDWKREKCIVLAKKCFQLLPENGLIILHEMLFDDAKEGPFLTSAYNMKMMTWTEGQQFSFTEIKNILQEAGFGEINYKKSLGNWSLVIGRKRTHSL